MNAHQESTAPARASDTPPHAPGTDGFTPPGPPHLGPRARAEHTAFPYVPKSPGRGSGHARTRASRSPPSAPPGTKAGRPSRGPLGPA